MTANKRLASQKSVEPEKIMDPAKQYLGDIIGGSIMLRDSRIIGALLLTKPDEATWSHRLKNDNILQKTSMHSAKRFASTLRKRLLPMGDEFIQALIDADDSLARQMLLLSIMNDSPVIVDFMKSVLADAHNRFRQTLEPDCWHEFYEQRAAVIPELSRYSDSSIKKMGNNVIKVLADTHYLESGRTKALQKVYVQAELLDWVDKLQKPLFIDALQSGR
jgi:hypothetical protein